MELAGSLPIRRTKDGLCLFRYAYEKAGWFEAIGKRSCQRLDGAAALHNLGCAAAIHLLRVKPLGAANAGGKFDGGRAGVTDLPKFAPNRLRVASSLNWPV